MSQLKPLMTLTAVFSLPVVSLAHVNSVATHTLKPTPKTVAWGYYDARAVLVLRIKSGDTVEIQTLIANSPKRLEDASLRPDRVEQSLRVALRFS